MVTILSQPQCVGLSLWCATCNNAIWWVCDTYRDHSVYAPSQWEMALHCNAISHWFGAYTEWSLTYSSDCHITRYTSKWSSDGGASGYYMMRKIIFWCWILILRMTPIKALGGEQDGGHFVITFSNVFSWIKTFALWFKLYLTHWGRVTHICVSNLTIIGPDNGLSPGRRQAIIWTNAGILLIGPWGTNFNKILIGIQAFFFKEMHLKMASPKWHPFCLGLNVLSSS